MSDAIMQWIVEIGFHQLWLGALIALLQLFMLIPKGRLQSVEPIEVSALLQQTVSIVAAATNSSSTPSPVDAKPPHASLPSRQSSCRVGRRHTRLRTFAVATR